MRVLPFAMICAGAAFAALCATTSAQACERAFGNSTYRLTPLQEDGLSSAQRTTCARGTLSGYSPVFGWVDMVDPEGYQIIAQDLSGLDTGGYEFMVAIGPSGEVVMRWGDMAGGQFFVNDAAHSTFMMPIYRNGQQVPARRIDGISRAAEGRLSVSVISQDNFECVILSDANLNFDGNWDCIAPH